VTIAGRVNRKAVAGRLSLVVGKGPRCGSS
jgi:hypothetical protein